MRTYKNGDEYNPCGKEGKWCFIGALVAEVENNKACADVVMPLTENLVSPVLRDMSTVIINFGNGQSADILREDIKKAIKKDIYKSIYKGLI